MKLPPVLLLLVSVLISNDKLHKVITTLALELQGQKQSFFERDRRSIAFLQIAILRSDKSRKVGQIATRCSVLRALLSIVSIAEYCERC